MSDESIKAPATPDNSLAPGLNYVGNKVKVKFVGCCLKQDKITYTRGKIVNIYIADEINLWNYAYNDDPTLGNSLFGAAKLVKKADIDKYKYNGYDIRFDMKGTFGFPAIGFARNGIIFGVDMSSSPYVDNRKKYILILGIQHTMAAEKMFSINFTEHNKKSCLGLHYNGANSYLFLNGTFLMASLILRILIQNC